MKEVKQNNNLIRNLSTILLIGGAAALAFLFIQEKTEFDQYKSHIQEQSTYFEAEHNKVLYDLNMNVEQVAKGESIKNIQEEYDFSQRTNEQIDLIQNNLKGVNHYLGEIENENQKLEDDLTIITDKYNEKRRDLRKNNAELDKANLQIADLQIENELLKNELDNLIVENEEIQLQLEAKQAEIEWFNNVFMQTEELTIKQKNKITELKEELSAAYYIVDTQENLKDSELLSNQGFFSLWNDYQVNPNIIKDDLNRIDKFKYTTIPVYSKKAKLVTNHHPDSYEWKTSKEGVEYLLIKNPVKFWEASNFLVIVTKKPFYEGHESEEVVAHLNAK